MTADFVYVRLHGDQEIYASGYTDQALSRWAARVETWRHGREPVDAERASPNAAPELPGRDVYVYFDNDIKVRAPFDAMTLARMLGVTPDASEPKAAELPRPGLRRSEPAPRRDRPRAAAAAERRGVPSR